MWSCLRGLLVGARTTTNFRSPDRDLLHVVISTGDWTEFDADIRSDTIGLADRISTRTRADATGDTPRSGGNNQERDLPEPKPGSTVRELLLQHQNASDGGIVVDATGASDPDFRSLTARLDV